MKKRALSFLLALVMVVSTMVTASIMVVAADHEAGDVVDNTPSTVTPSDATNTSLFTGTPDFSWFKVENTGTDVSPAYAIVAPENDTYVLNSADAFVGFRDLTNAKGKGFCDLDDDGVVDEGELVDMAAQTFDGYTVKLGVNIVINTGDAEDWGRYNRTGLYEWTPIAHDMYGTNLFFAGTFDGDGHYISGIYSNANWTGSQTNVSNGNGTYNGRDNGLFGYVKGGTVTNFVLTNSTFVAWNTDRDSNGNGLITKMNNDATLENVYSDAHVSGQWNVGGLVGNLGASGTNSVTGCIFAGKLEITRDADGWGPFVGHADSAATGGIVDCLYMGSAFPSARLGLSATRTARIVDMPFAVSGNIPYANSIRVIDGVEKTTTSFTANANWKTVTIKGESRRVPATAWDNYSKWFTVDTAAPAAVTNGYNGTPTYDWYVASVDSTGVVTKVDTTATNGKFVIDSASDLYGFSYLSNGIAVIDGVTVAVQHFDGDTIVLGADITVNGGDASTWSYENQPTYEWIPVGHESKWVANNNHVRYFSGTFDGQGHTISGLFSDTFWNDSRLTYQSPIGGGYNGAQGSFICHAVEAEIKNFSLVNSAFVSFGAHLGNAQGFGTIDAADEGTTISNIYSEVILQGGYAVGGIAGFMRPNATIADCVWAGEMRLNSGAGMTAGGIVGSFDGTVTNFSRKISDCLSIGTITYSQNLGNSDTFKIGGIGGSADAGVAINNVVSANVVNAVTKTGGITKDTFGAIVGSITDARVILEDTVYDGSLIPSGVTGIKGKDDTYQVNGEQLEGADTPDDTTDDVYEEITYGATREADLASFDASEWSAWTDLVADIPVPTAAWALAQKTFDDVKLAFVQETDVTTIENGDNDYEGYTVRLAAEIFNLEATEAGFELLVGEEYVDLGSSTTVYKSLNAKGADGEIGQVKADYGKYFTALEVNVASGNSVSFTVRPYIVIESETTYGTAYTITYDAEGAFVSAVAAN